MDTTARPVTALEAVAINAYLRRIEMPEQANPHVVRWAHLRLPNGQIARSAWKESLKPLTKLRMSRNVKVSLFICTRRPLTKRYQLSHENRLGFGEIQFFFRVRHGDETDTLALVSLFGPPHAGLLEQSYHTIWSCERQVENALQVIDVKTIQSVVAMIPHQPRIPGERRKDRFFVVEKPGLDVADLGGYEEAVAEE